MAKGLKRGDVLKGRYEIQRQIGKGGMSRVFMAADLQLNNKLWAVKEVDRKAKDPAGRPIEQALAREADILSKLDHPKIVSIVDIETTDDFIYIVMDYVEGESLDKIIRREGPQSEANVQQWMLEICDVLGYLHSQNPPIIYRDMKPNNIMLHPDGYVKLIDFGVVREYKDEADVRQDTIAFGTQGYAPPEQYGKAQTDPRADIYAMGATMWHLLAGEAPSMEFPLRNVREKRPEVGQGFADVIIPRCTQLERDMRYQSCEELAADLRIYEELTKEFRDEQLRRVRGFAVSAVLAVVLFIAGFGLLGARDVSIADQYSSYLTLGDNMVQSNPGNAGAKDDPEEMKKQGVNEDDAPSGAQEQYLNAIEKKHDGIDAYLGLAESYRVDDTFSQHEKAQLDGVYQKYLDELQASDRYAELAYEIGSLYWTYYEVDPDSSDDSDDNRATRIKFSAEYFKQAAEHFDSADNSEKARRSRIYNDVARYTSDISRAINEGNDNKEYYEGFFNSLVTMADQLSSEKGELVHVDNASFIANMLETYMDKFENIGEIPEDDMKSVIDTVEDSLESLSPTENRNKRMKEDILSRLNREVTRKMATVYSDATVGN